MTLSQLEVFAAIIQLKSFTRAGQELGLTQSAISHSISNLESQLGITLLERSRNGVKLTNSGEKIYEYTLEILKNIELINDEVSSLKNIPKGTLRIGSFPSITASILPRIISSFRRYYPQVEVVLFEGSDQEVLSWIKSGIVDMGFVTLPNNELDSIYLTQDEMYVILPQEHQLKDARFLDVNQIYTESFILSKGGCEPLIKDIFGSAGMEPNVKYKIRDMNTILTMVQEGLGITIVPELALSNISLNRITTISLNPPVYRKLALAAKDFNSENVIEKAFIEKAKHCIKLRSCNK